MTIYSYDPRDREKDPATRSIEAHGYTYKYSEDIKLGRLDYYSKGELSGSILYRHDGRVMIGMEEEKTRH